MNTDHLPKLADGTLAYPGMVVFEHSPHSIHKVYDLGPIHSIEGSPDEGYWISFVNRINLDTGDPGNLEPLPTRLYSTRENALAAQEKFEKDQES